MDCLQNNNDSVKIEIFIYDNSNKSYQVAISRNGDELELIPKDENITECRFELD